MTLRHARPLLTDVLAAHTPTPATIVAGAEVERWGRAMRRLPDAARRSVAELRTLLASTPAKPAVLDLLAAALAASNNEPIATIRARLAASRVPRATRGTWLSLREAVAEAPSAGGWDAIALHDAAGSPDRPAAGPITAVRLATSWALLTAAAHRTREYVASVVSGASDDLQRTAITAGVLPARIDPPPDGGGAARVRMARLFGGGPGAVTPTTHPREC